MMRTAQLHDLVGRSGLSVEKLAALIDVPPVEVEAWIAGTAPAPESLITFLLTYLELKSISDGVSCPLPR